MQTQALTKKPTIRRTATKVSREASAMPVANALRTGAIRAKLKLGSPSDPQESEADRVADQVVGMPAPAPALVSSAQPRIHREAAPAAGEEEQPIETLRRQAQDSPVEEDAQLLHRAEAAVAEPGAEEEQAPAGELETESGDTPGEKNPGEEDSGEGGALDEPSKDEMEALGQEMKAKAVSGISPEGEVAPATAARVLQPGPGRPLDTETRAFMEPRFRANFSTIRIHDASEDRETSAKLGARAFAHGSHIWLGPNERTSDRRLMAHELTHVVQNKPGMLRSPLGPVRSRRTPQRTPAVRRILGWLPDSVRAKLAGWAANVPGYTLLTFILGQNPITGKAVERNALNLVGALMGLIPGGTRLFQLLKDSGALQKFFTWVSTAFNKLNLSLQLVLSLIKKAWDAASGLYSPSRNIQIITDVFAPTFSRIWTFLKALASKVMEFVFEGAMAIAGPFATRVFGIIKKVGSVIGQIISDPIGFVGNLVKALLKGFNQFKTNIVTHLKQGIFAWLFGALSGAGLTLPKEFNLKGIVSIVTQVLGLTYARMRKKLVKIMGEKRVAMLEKGIELLRILVTQGIAGIWQKLVEYVGSLKEIVIGKIRNWIVTKIVTAAVTKLVSMFNPAGAVIQAITAVYNTIRFFIEKAKQIADLVESVFNSIGAIAAGKLSAAANFVEQAMGRTIPVIIGFLARLIGLGGISAKIKDIIKTIQAKVDKAVEKVIAIIIKKGKALWGKAKAKVGEKIRQLLRLKDVPIKMSEGQHTLKVNRRGAKSVIELHSDPQTLRAFLNRTETDPTLQDERAKKYRQEARSELDTLEPMLKAFDTAAAATSAGGTGMSSADTVAKLAAETQSQFERVARPIRLLIDQRSNTMNSQGDLEKAKIRYSRYDLEGMVASYAQMPREGGDEFTPDHQPQAAALKHAARMPEFADDQEYGTTKGLYDAAMSGHARGAFTINLRNIRHSRGATFGQSPSEFKKDADEAQNLARKQRAGADSKNIGAEVRKQVVAVLRNYAREDANAMDDVYGNTADTGTWKDVHDLYKQNPALEPKVGESKMKLIERIKIQVMAGEQKIRNQNMSRYEN